ncbi:hypothetical protein LY76DRAFT_61088 [Colletotrichum caudatum]|nr:hypothetical protein LY76DRAFT_61088 [Colletotrichum caudatum]
MDASIRPTRRRQVLLRYSDAERARAKTCHFGSAMTMTRMNAAAGPLGALLAAAIVVAESEAACRHTCERAGPKLIWTGIPIAVVRARLWTTWTFQTTWTCQKKKTCAGGDVSNVVRFYQSLACKISVSFFRTSVTIVMLRITS